MKKSIFITVALFAFTSFTNQLFAQEAALKTRTKSNNTNEKSTGNVTPIDDWQQQNAKAAQGQHIKEAKLVCRVIPTETGCTIEVAGITGGVVAGKNGKSSPKLSYSCSVSVADNSATEIESPRDASSGLATGKRMHKPFVITKELDKSSPTLAESAAKGREASAPSVSEIVVTKSGVQASQSSGMGAGKATFKEFTVTKRCDGKTTKISCPDGECDIPIDDCSNGTCDLECSWSWGATQQGTSMNSSSSGLSRCSVDFVLEIEEGVCHAITKKGDPRSGYDLAPAKK
jgi:type VI protein secretion system component Hcp